MMSSGPMTETGGRIVVSHLTKKYGEVTAVDDLSFTVRSGRVTGFLGPNGAGKTTTLRMMLDLVRPTGGTATIGGVRYADLPDPLRSVGAVLDASGAHLANSGRKHLRILLAAAGLPAARADAVLAETGLRSVSRRKINDYSLGMRQRLGIAAALLGDPQVLVLDEPANGLDPEGIHWLREFLRSRSRQGRTVLISSHLLSEMQLLADEVVIIAAGRLVAQGTIEQIIDAAGRSGSGPGPVRVRTPQADALGRALERMGAEVIKDGEVLQISGIDAPAIGGVALRAGIELHELTAEAPDLEQAFLRLTQGKAAIR